MNKQNDDFGFHTYPDDTVGAIRIGISSCLLGEEVRWNGGHTRDAYLTETLGEYFEWVPVCPEEEVGMGVPRERVRLVGEPDNPRMVGIESGEDWTERMTEYAQNRVEELQERNLHGYILKKGSPSCSYQTIHVLGDDGDPTGESRGLFARELLSRTSLLPVEDEGRLHDSDLRENFIERIFAFYRWRELTRNDPSPEDLVEFHTAHKITLMAHHPEKARELGRLVSDAGNGTFSDRLTQYGTSFMETMDVNATPGRHANAMNHLQGYLRDYLTDPDRQELTHEINKYREGITPLIVPVTLLCHHFRKHPVDWVMKQTYLAPYPEELSLRNHV